MYRIIMRYMYVTLTVDSEKKNYKYKRIESVTIDYNKISIEMNKINTNQIISYKSLTATLQALIHRLQEWPWIDENIIKLIQTRNKLCEKHKPVHKPEEIC